MRELIEDLVARGGAERAAARMAVGIHQRILCEQSVCEEDRARRARATIDDELMDTEAPTASVLTDRAASDTPITTIYAGEKFLRDAIEQIAGAIPSFGVLD